MKNTRRYLISAGIAGAMTACLYAVEVVTPAEDLSFLVTKPDTLDKVVDLEEVFSGVDHLYGVSWTPDGILTAEVRDDAKIDLHVAGDVFGSVDVTVTAQDATGDLATDTVRVTLRSTRMYVDANTAAPAGQQDGATWQSAFRNLQDGLANLIEDQTELWVADGVYYPDVDAAGDSDDRARSFRMVEKVSLYGGFAGGELERDERDPLRNLSILSGDITQDDSQRPIASHVRLQIGDLNNSFRVVDMSGSDNKDALDGFVITAGRADSAPDHVNGAGVFTRKDVFIENCWITGNYAAGNGGGVFQSENKPVFTNCRINGNAAGGAGGGIYAFKDDPTFFNCEIRGNRADEGGGLYLEEPEFELVSCLLSGNKARSGGAVRVFNGKLLLVNCTLTGNYSVEPGGAVNLAGTGEECKFKNVIIWANQGGGTSAGPEASIHIGDGKTPKVYHSLVAHSGGSAAWNGSAGSDEDGNLDLDPRFLLPIVPAAEPTENGYFSLRVDSPVLDMGLQKHLLNDQPDLDEDSNRKEKVSIDLAGRGRVVGAEIDLGAYEFDPDLLLDTDGDGLSDVFEIVHAGDPVILPAMSDGDGDNSKALGEFLHGMDPNLGGEDPAACIGTMEHLGETYLTITFRVDPDAINFVTYTVERCGEPSTSLNWLENETVEVIAAPSASDPSMLEVTHRSILPLGQDEREFLRVRHDVINPALPVLP